MGIYDRQQLPSLPCPARLIFPSKRARPDYVPGLGGHARLGQLLRVGRAEVGLAGDDEPHGVLRLLEGLVVLLPGLQDVLGDAVEVGLRQGTCGRNYLSAPAIGLFLPACALATLVSGRHFSSASQLAHDSIYKPGRHGNIGNRGH